MKKTKLKSELTNKLISEGLVQENDVIRHSYTNNRINDWETRGTQVKDNNISPTIDTRCDCLGVVVREGGLFDNENGTHQAGSVYNENGLSPSLDTMQGGYRQPMIEEKKSNLRIRKLTPCECYKLMGFSEEDYKKASQVNSDSQLYKQAGNSIVVNVLMAIFGEMLDTKDEREEGENDIMPKLMGGGLEK